MKAFVKDDIILQFHIDGDTEIGEIPLSLKGKVGIERLRFDGNSIVDIADYTGLWVEKNREGKFVLHVIEVPNSIFISDLTYGQRKYLINNSTGIRLMTDMEIIDRENNYKRNHALSSLKSNLKRELILNDLTHTALICALIVYVKQQPAVISNLFDQIIPDIIDTFPLDRWESIIKENLLKIKIFIEKYYNEIDEIN